MTIRLETQEAGTGKWFPILIYTPGSESQKEDALKKAAVLQALGLYAAVVPERDKSGAAG